MLRIATLRENREPSHPSCIVAAMLGVVPWFLSVEGFENKIGETKNKEMNVMEEGVDGGEGLELEHERSTISIGYFTSRCVEE